MLQTKPDAINFADALGERLMAHGHIDAKALSRATQIAGELNERLDRALAKLGMVRDVDLAQAIAEILDVPVVSARDFPDHRVVDCDISSRFLSESRAIPLADTTEGVEVAMADPLDDYAIQALELITGRPVLPRVAVPADIETAIERVYGSSADAMGDIIDDVSGEDDATDDEHIARLRDLASEAPVIRLVNLLIGRAVESRASDVHIEPFESTLRVRYRIDGVLREAESPPPRFRDAVISRIKIMAGLNIAERRLPQDGRTKMSSRGKEIDLRISTVPTMHGESVVMRILDRREVFDLGSLGFDKHAYDGFQQVLHRPHGIIIVTGPTGSGKTTTLYASLLELNTPDRKILSVEDPVEYQLDGVNQVQVKPQIGLTFANVLRSFLRQDPDVMMIGEIRDLETAEIAVQAALTGHVVLSSLHTNSAAAAIPRLLDMGVDDYLITSTLNAVVAQRLVRTLCSACREPTEALPELVDHLDLRRFQPDGPITLYRSRGCEACGESGYTGRTTILELLAVTDDVRRLVLDQTEAHEIERAALASGMRSMFEDGVRKSLAGVTSIEEVLRATRAI